MQIYPDFNFFGGDVVWRIGCTARLAQLVERKALNLEVVGSSPTVSKSFCIQMSETYTHALRAAAKVSVQQDGRAQTE